MRAKRSREDGHLSKEEYTKQQTEDSLRHSSPGTWKSASTEVLASRRIVTGPPTNKRTEFTENVQTLNESFIKYIRTHLHSDPGVSLAEAAQDYIDYVVDLKDQYLRTFGEVFTFGTGDCGQLAHGIDKDEDLIVSVPRIVYSLRDKRVCYIACGGLHNAVVTEDGRVFTWGCNDDGALGRTGKESENMPAIVNGIDGDVIRVSAGETHTMALTLAGKVYGWGSYKDKEGKQWFTPPRHSSHIQRKQEEPLEIPGVSDAIDIVCGGNFNVVRCKNGDLLSWGLGEWGELCRPVCAMKRNRVYNEADILHDHLKPGQMFLESDEPAREARSVGAGTYHVLVVMGGGNSVYSSGLNNYGQLGLDLADREENRKKERLTLIEALEGEKVSHAAGGTHHSLVLTSTGSVFSFGRGDKGELGTGRRYKEGFFSTKPLLLRFPDSKGTPCAIACGANHNLVLTDRTEVYTWGFGDNSALGHGRDDDEVGPKTLKLKNRGQITDLGEVVQVAGGGQHSVILATMIANASSRYQYF